MELDEKLQTCWNLDHCHVEVDESVIFVLENESLTKNLLLVLILVVNDFRDGVKVNTVE